MKHFFLFICPFLLLQSNAQEINKDAFPFIGSAKEVNIPTGSSFLDTDEDGIVDSKDKCPQTKEGIEVDAKGCQVKSVAKKGIDTLKLKEKVAYPKTLKINFQLAEYKILASSHEEIKKLAQFLQENKSYDVIVYGYTDSANKSGKNKKLSQRRANAVVNALVAHGVKLRRLTAIGMGSKNPIADNNTPEGRAKNRRIEVHLIK